LFIHNSAVSARDLMKKEDENIGNFKGTGAGTRTKGNKGAQKGRKRGKSTENKEKASKRTKSLSGTRKTAYLGSWEKLLKHGKSSKSPI
jgi:hypothetical protein